MGQHGEVWPFDIVDALVDGRIHQPRVECVPIAVTAQRQHAHRRAVADGNRVDRAPPRRPGAPKRHCTTTDARQHLGHGARLAYLNVHGRLLVSGPGVEHIVTPGAVRKGFNP